MFEVFVKFHAPGMSSREGSGPPSRRPEGHSIPGPIVLEERLTGSTFFFTSTLTSVDKAGILYLVVTKFCDVDLHLDSGSDAQLRCSKSEVEGVPNL